MNEKQQRAKTALNQLFKLGFSQSTIAMRLGVDPTTICHINTMRLTSKSERPSSKSEFYVGEGLAIRLEQLLLECRKEVCHSLLHNLPIFVIETCNQAGVMVTEELRADIRNSIEESFSSKFDPDALEVALPSGIAAAIAYLGNDLVLIKMQTHNSDNPSEDQVKQTRLLIHELQHLISRLRSQLPESKETPRHESAY